MIRFLLAFILLPFLASSQSADYRLLQGKVVNAKTGAPLPYAHVGIPERGIGTTTSYSGAFTLKIPDYYRDSRLTVSYIGFETYSRPLSALNTGLEVRLQPSAALLQEIVVMDERRIEDIIRRAVGRIPDNYPDQPVNLRAFYRESRTDEQQEYVYLAEGVLKLYKSSYRNDKEGQVGLVQGRQVGLVPEDELQRRANFSSGHLAGHRFDFVKYREDFINEKYFPAYQYWVENLTEWDGQPVYVIGFDRADGNKSARMKGKVYIDTLNYAFVRAEFEILPDAQRKIDDYPLYSGNWQSNRYTVNYRPVDGTWQLSDALREGIYRDGGQYTNEIIITEVLPGRGQPIPYMQRLGRDDKFLNVTGEYDESFWAAYNTAPINDPKLAKRLERFRNQQKAEEVFDTAYIAQLQRVQDSIRQVQSEQAPEEAAASLQLDRLAYTRSFAERRLVPFDLRLSYAAGAHLIRSEAARYEAVYEIDDEAPSGLLLASGDLPRQEVQPIYQLALDGVIRERWLVRFGLSRDLASDVYRETTVGIGTQFNLSKRKRPVLIRPLVQYSRLFFGRRIGKADNDYGNFEVDGKRFKSEQVRLFYGERRQQLNLNLEMAIELNPSRELFLRLGYHLPFQDESMLFLRETSRLFRKRARILTGADTRISRNGEPYEGSMSLNEPGFSLTIGLLLK